MKTLIIGLLAAVGLVNTTEVRNVKELSMKEVPPMIYPGEYKPISIAYNATWAATHPVKVVAPTKKKAKKK